MNTDQLHRLFDCLSRAQRELSEASVIAGAKPARANERCDPVYYLINQAWHETNEAWEEINDRRKAAQL